MRRLSAVLLLAAALHCGVPSISFADEPPAATTPSDASTSGSGPSEHECEHRKKEPVTS